MLQIYSTTTGKYYETMEEAQKAENETVIESKINAIYEQHNKEVTGRLQEIDDIEKKIQQLTVKMNRLKTEVDQINDEAQFEIEEIRKSSTTPKQCYKKATTNNETNCSNLHKKTSKEVSTSDDAECSVRIDTFNSEDGEGWKSLFNKSGKVDDVMNDLLKAIKKVTPKSTLKELLKEFNI